MQNEQELRAELEYLLQDDFFKNWEIFTPENKVLLHGYCGVHTEITCVIEPLGKHKYKAKSYDIPHFENETLGTTEMEHIVYGIEEVKDTIKFYEEVGEEQNRLAEDFCYEQEYGKD